MDTNNDWFKRLTGFKERSPDEVREHLSVHANRLTSHVNGESFVCGRLEIVSLQELRDRVEAVENGGVKLRVSELLGDARALHVDAANAGALFQVASQFNLLEMVSPSVTPEHGITIYENDPTQGPACAIACGAGTIYRNYFVELAGQIGQTTGRQVDCLADLAETLESKFLDRRGEVKSLWEMKNGYALPSIAGLNQVDSMLASMLEAELDTLRAKLRIGLQWDTQVTLDGCSHLVTQAYCSALPVAYGGWPAGLWKRFAMLVLEAAYEATLAVAVLNASKSGNNLVYLTLLGGGAFGNEPEWILDAMRRACRLYLPRDLDLKIVSHRSSNPGVQELVNSINGEVRKMPSPRRVRVEQDSPCHYCPGCGTAQKMFSRYPWYFCQACVSLAEDGSGRRLAFGNSSLSGGLCWKYADKVEASAEECVTVACLILGRPVMVTEARFGGVVAQPLTSQVMKLTDSYKFVDLR